MSVENPIIWLYSEADVATDENACKIGQSITHKSCADSKLEKSLAELADINCPITIPHAVPTPPLLQAIDCRNNDIVRLILQKGANPEAFYDDESPVGNAFAMHASAVLDTIAEFAQEQSRSPATFNKDAWIVEQALKYAAVVAHKKASGAPLEQDYFDCASQKEANIYLVNIHAALADSPYEIVECLGAGGEAAIFKTQMNTALRIEGPQDYPIDALPVLKPFNEIKQEGFTLRELPIGLSLERLVQDEMIGKEEAQYIIRKTQAELQKAGLSSRGCHNEQVVMVPINFNGRIEFSPYVSDYGDGFSNDPPPGEPPVKVPEPPSTMRTGWDGTWSVQPGEHDVPKEKFAIPMCSPSSVKDLQSFIDENSETPPIAQTGLPDLEAEDRPRQGDGDQMGWLFKCFGNG